MKARNLSVLLIFFTVTSKLARVFPGGASLMSQNFPKKRPKHLSSSGFTLVEVMLALFVFAIGMLAVTAMCLISIKGNSLTNRMTQANFLAQSKMEELMSKADMTALDAQDNSLENGIDGNGAAGGSYSRSIDVATVVSEPDVRWITVNVSWVDSKGNHQVALKSMTRSR